MITTEEKLPIPQWYNKKKSVVRVDPIHLRLHLGRSSFICSNKPELKEPAAFQRESVSAASVPEVVHLSSAQDRLDLSWQQSVLGNVIHVTLAFQAWEMEDCACHGIWLHDFREQLKPGDEASGTKYLQKGPGQSLFEAKRLNLNFHGDLFVL